MASGFKIGVPNYKKYRYRTKLIIYVNLLLKAILTA